MGVFVKSATSQRNLVQDRSVVSGLKCLGKKKKKAQVLAELQSKSMI